MVAVYKNFLTLSCDQQYLVAQLAHLQVLTIKRLRLKLNEQTPPSNVSVRKRWTIGIPYLLNHTILTILTAEWTNIFCYTAFKIALTPMHLHYRLIFRPGKYLDRNVWKTWKLPMSLPEEYKNYFCFYIRRIHYENLQMYGVFRSQTIYIWNI